MLETAAGERWKAGRRRRLMPRISGWVSLLLRRLGVRWVEPGAAPPDWDDAEQW